LAGPEASKDEARLTLARLLTGQPLSQEGRQARHSIRDLLAELLLDREGKDITPHALRNLASHCRILSRAFGDRDATGLKPVEVEDWMAKQKWKPTYKKALVTTLESAVVLAVRRGDLDRDPLAGLRRPRAGRREHDLAVREKLIEAATEPLKTYMKVLHETGCRPGELAEATAADLDIRNKTLVVRNKTRRSTGRSTRTVYLFPEALKILAKAAKAHPTGPLLRAARGGAWKKDARDKAFTQVRDQVGTKETLYVFRVGWVTDALAGGVPAAIVAELAGHSTLVMMKHYARLSDRSDVLREAVALIRPGAISAKRRAPRRH
jgi:integrase